MYGVSEDNCGRSPVGRQSPSFRDGIYGDRYVCSGEDTRMEAVIGGLLALATLIFVFAFFFGREV
jgi:hypothetical protein